jgi:hypothetical protein
MFLNKCLKQRCKWQKNMINKGKNIQIESLGNLNMANLINKTIFLLSLVFLQAIKITLRLKAKQVMQDS